MASLIARDRIGSAFPMAAAESGVSWSIVGAGSLGMSSVCPFERGFMSKKANTCSFSYSLRQGISPSIILVKSVLPLI